MIVFVPIHAGLLVESLGRERIASASEAAALIEALLDRDSALWATAFYAGLRRGELQALRREDVKLAVGLLRVERSWDEKGRQIIEPKSAAGRRTVPIPAELRRYLVEHRLAIGRHEGFVFGGGSVPFAASTAWRRAHTVWELEGLAVIGFHEARHRSRCLSQRA